MLVVAEMGLSPEIRELLVWNAMQVESVPSADVQAVARGLKCVNADVLIIYFGNTLPTWKLVDVTNLRDAGITIPIIAIMHTRDRVRDLTTFLFAGGDAFIDTPFHKDELEAVIMSCVRRTKTFGTMSSLLAIYSHGIKVTIDTSIRRLALDGVQVSLTGSEYDLFERLARTPDVLVSKDTLLADIYKGRDVPEIKIIDVFVCKIRKKLLQAHPHGDLCLQTVWGRGYMIARDAGTTAQSAVA